MKRPPSKREVKLECLLLDAYKIISPSYYNSGTRILNGINLSRWIRGVKSVSTWLVKEPT